MPSLGWEYSQDADGEEVLDADVPLLPPSRSPKALNEFIKVPCMLILSNTVKIFTEIIFTMN